MAKTVKDLLTDWGMIPKPLLNESDRTHLEEIANKAFNMSSHDSQQRRPIDLARWNSKEAIVIASGQVGTKSYATILAKIGVPVKDASKLAGLRPGDEYGVNYQKLGNVSPGTYAIDYVYNSWTGD